MHPVFRTSKGMPGVRATYLDSLLNKERTQMVWSSEHEFFQQMELV